MPKPLAVNPKLAFLRKIFAKARPALLRGMGTLGRVQVNPSAAAAEVAKLEHDLGEIIHGALTAAGLPFAMAPAHGTPLPFPTGWLYTPLFGRRNAEHALGWCGAAIAFLQDGRVAAAGILTPDMEDPCLIAAGEGATCGDRLRASGRTLADAILLMTTVSADSARLKLLQHAEKVPFHTRKTGAPLMDALLVARGHADVMVATRLSDFELLLADFLMKESAATAKTLPDDTFVGGNTKIVGELTALLAKGA